MKCNSVILFFDLRLSTTLIDTTLGTETMQKCPLSFSAARTLELYICAVNRVRPVHVTLTMYMWRQCEPRTMPVHVSRKTVELFVVGVNKKKNIEKKRVRMRAYDGRSLSESQSSQFRTPSIIWRDYAICWFDEWTRRSRKSLCTMTMPNGSVSFTVQKEHHIKFSLKTTSHNMKR